MLYLASIAFDQVNSFIESPVDRQIKAQPALLSSMSSITGLRTIIGEKEQKESFYLEEIERLKVIIDQSAVQRERMVEVEVIARKDAEQREINIQSDLAKLKQNYQTAMDTVSALSREVEFVRRQYAMLQQ